MLYSNLASSSADISVMFVDSFARSRSSTVRSERSSKEPSKKVLFLRLLLTPATIATQEPTARNIPVPTVSTSQRDMR